ncbi:MAG: prepilin-type N-terminal cleavage/methylation domain-containing protein [Candidatus Moraniibacteriota bacterium]
MKNDLLGRGRICLSTKKGFTLLETLIAVLLFSFISVMVSGVFATFLKNYTESKKTLQGVEGAQFAMNLMAKTIRTSDVRLNADGKTLEIYDFAQKKCLKYSWVDGVTINGVMYGKMQVNTRTTTKEGAVSNCGDFLTNMGGPEDITSNDVINVSFNVDHSDQTKMGFVTIALTVEEPGQQSSPLQIQMTVSLRNLGGN